jgi:hypothetical protein
MSHLADDRQSLKAVMLAHCLASSGRDEDLLAERSGMQRPTHRARETAAERTTIPSKLDPRGRYRFQAPL